MNTLFFLTFIIFFPLTSLKLMDPLTWDTTDKEVNIHMCLVTPQRALSLPPPSPPCHPWNKDHFGPWFYPPKGGGRLGYCNGFVFAENQRGMCGQDGVGKKMMKGKGVYHLHSHT